MPTIFLKNKDQSMSELPPVEYVDEDTLQELLANYPKLISIDDDPSQEGSGLLLVSREAPVPDDIDGSRRFRLDHLFLDQEGVPILVEVKRATDNRIRRELVGQMLDYAANAVEFWNSSLIKQAFDIRCQSQRVDPESTLIEFLGDNKMYKNGNHLTPAAR